ncbi:hypothetical protein [Ideonella sp. YS5]|uniref:hypothetical protein n=1 Tax=Ideonella sp. YS5 TaxID=3453714 RepID=UPI003EEAC67E
MFHGIKLPHRTSTRPADNQPLLPKGSGSASGSSSAHAHPELAGRGSPGAGPSAMAPRGSPFLKRSDALSPHAQANAQAAFPGQRLRFAADASIVQEGVKVGQAPVEFGAKPKPTKVGSPRLSPSVAAPPPEPPPSTQRQEPKRGLFGNIFSSSQATASHQAPSSAPPRPAQTNPASAAHASTSRTPAEKFNERLTKFMSQCPEGTLKRTLRSYLAQGNFQGFRNEVIKSLSQHKAPNQAAHEALMLMNSSLHKMSDFSGVALQEYVASSPLQSAGATSRTPAEKFSERLTKFMNQCPDGTLRRTLQLHVAQGNFQGFRNEVTKALTEHKAPDQAAYEGLMLMNSSLHKMSDFSGVRINYAKARA